MPITPFSVSGQVAYALLPSDSNQRCAASWPTWAGSMSAMRTLTSGKTVKAIRRAAR